MTAGFAGHAGIGDGDRLFAAARWVGAGLAVTLAYGVALGHLLREAPPPPIPQESAPQAILVELEPMAVATRSDAVMPETQAAEPEPVPEPVETPPPDVAIPPAPVEEAEALLPQPVPGPPPEPKTPEPERKVEAKPRPESKTKPKSAEARREQVARSSRPTEPVVRASGGAGGEQARAEASWRARLMSHLNRFKQAPPGGGTGVVTIAFRVAPSGQVVSVSLTRSSGDPGLDQAALAMIRRANPVPTPPEGTAQLSFVVPVNFSRR